MKKSLLTLFGMVASIGLSAQVIFNVLTPAAVQGTYPLSYATSANSWGVADLNDPNESVTGTLALVDDGTAADSLGCNALTNGSAIAGKIAVIYRGSCSFGIKARFAQQAGAIGIIIISNQDAQVTSFNMLGGAEGLEVTVPTIIIDKTTGALLRPYLDAGSLTAFIGNKLGNFPVDLGYKEEMVLYPQMASRQIGLAKAPGDFPVQTGMFIYNYGSQDQSNVVATVTIKKNGTQVFSDTKANLTINAGDSLDISFGTYDPAWTIGNYDITYTITPASADGYAGDNVKTAAFAITDSTISYAPPISGSALPDANTFIKSTDIQPIFYCMSFRDAKANLLKFLGFSFALTPMAPHQLTNEYLELELYEWNDAFVDLNEAATFDDLTSVAVAEYTYQENLADSTVYVPYSDGSYTFKSNQRYLACVKALSDSIYFGFTNHVNYDLNLNTYLQPISPLKSGGTWYSAGFGTDQTNAMGVHAYAPGVGVNEVTLNSEIVPFPIPSTSVVNVPFGAKAGKTAEVVVLDLTGKMVTTLKGSFNGSTLQVNTGDLSNGNYMFNVTVDNGVTSSFKVLISK